MKGKFVLALCFVLFAFTFLGRNLNEIAYGVAVCDIDKKAESIDISSPPYVIAVDKGHGGVDTGAQHIVDEIDVIEKTGELLYELLEKDENFTPVFTRDKTSDPDSRQRCRVAKQAGASLLISLHANCDSHKSAHGFECYPIPKGRANHENSLKFAKILCKNMEQRGHYLRGENKDGIKYAFYSGKNKIIVDSTDAKIRSAKSFGILENSPCPRVLAEQCFITNYSDVENWATNRGCKKAAEIYYKSILEYFGLEKAK